MPCRPHTQSPCPLAPQRRFLAAVYGSHWELGHLVINAAALLLLLVPKLPEMHGVRLFGFNAADVDEDN